MKCWTNSTFLFKLKFYYKKIFQLYHATKRKENPQYFFVILKPAFMGNSEKWMEIDAKCNFAERSHIIALRNSAVISSCRIKLAVEWAAVVLRKYMLIWQCSTAGKSLEEENFVTLDNQNQCKAICMWQMSSWNHILLLKI